MKKIDLKFNIFRACIKYIMSSKDNKAQAFSDYHSDWALIINFRVGRKNAQ